MVHVLFCLFLLIPIVTLPVVLFLVSASLGIVVVSGVVSLVLAIPLVLAAYAHVDLVRVKSRYGLSDEEVEVFSRLVPRLAARPEFRSVEKRRSMKRAAAEIIWERRTRPGSPDAAGGDAAGTAPRPRRPRPRRESRS